MCDSGTILTDVFTKFDLPGIETVKDIEGRLDKATPLIKAGAEAYGAVSTSKEAQKQAGVRMAQVAFGSDIEKAQAQQVQERRLGANRAAFAKSGVKVTGSARRLLDEQIKQDEIELLKIKHNKDVNISNLQREARAARKEAQKQAGGAFANKDVLDAAINIFK
jgi:hypothetical protein